MPSFNTTCRADVDESGDECGYEYSVEYTVEADDHNYGADADGRRGIFVAGGVDEVIPEHDTCPQCGADLTSEEAVKRHVEKANEDLSDRLLECHLDYDED